MARPRVILNDAGVRALLTSPGVERELTARMTPVLAAARAAAPVDSGAYHDSLDIWTEVHTGRSRRIAVHVGSRAAHGLQVEGAHGVLSRAFDALGG